MQENFRQFLDRLRQNGELVDLHQAVDIRHIATLVDQAKTALFFHNVIGYDMPVVSGIIRSRERAMMGLGAETYREIEDKLSAAIAKPNVVASPTARPPSSYASGIIDSASRARIAPAAKESSRTTTCGPICPSTP